MIIIYTGVLLPLSVFLYAGFMRTLAPEYEEAAHHRRRLPLPDLHPRGLPADGARPPAPSSILAGLIVWNDFFTPLIFLNGSDSPTLPVVMYNYVGALVSQWNLIFAIVHHLDGADPGVLRRSRRRSSSRASPAG